MLTVEGERRRLPKVGDSCIIRSDTVGSIPAKVTYVNHENLWYQVSYDICGTTFKEGIKVPMVSNLSRDSKAKVNHTIKLSKPQAKSASPRKDVHNKGCRIVETGQIFESYTACAKFLRVTPSTVHSAIQRGNKCLGKYSIEKLPEGA